jgi:hypothetical protein
MFKEQDFHNRLAVTFGFALLIFAVSALAYSGSDDFGLDFVLTKIDSLLGGAAGVLLAIFLIVIAVVLIMKSAVIPGIIMIVCTFILIGVVGIAKKVSGLII